MEYISLVGGKENNLQNVSVKIPKNSLTVITGVSGSGKSSLAFDTIYAEGHARYMNSLTSYARQFLQLHDKPDVESISGLSPTIAINQKTNTKNPRSTVATVTEIYDYIRLLYSRIGVPHSPSTNSPITKHTVSQIVDFICNLPKKTKIHIVSPVVRSDPGSHVKTFATLKQKQYTRIKVDQILYQSIEEIPKLDHKVNHDISVIVDRIVVGEPIGNRLANSVETAMKLADGFVYIEINSIDTEEENVKEGKIFMFSEHYVCLESGFSIPKPEPNMFSFNSPRGACKDCNGIGTKSVIDPKYLVSDHRKSITEGAIDPIHNLVGLQKKNFINSLQRFAQKYNFSLTDPWRNIKNEIRNKIIFGCKEYMAFKGVVNVLQSIFSASELQKYMSNAKCTSCKGKRLNQQSLCVKITNLNISEVTNMTVEDAIEYFNNLKTKISDQEFKIAQKVLEEIIKRLNFLISVGLGYLVLGRESGTLSGGESQRIRLSSQLGSSLTGVTYVLDEPSIGLHQHDNTMLLNTLKNLRDLGNTVIVVEHDQETIESADYVIDVGPGAGVYGGKIIAEGTAQELKENKASITGLYISGKKQIFIPNERKKFDKKISLKGASSNNLKNLDVDFPLGIFVCVTGVSGGGKSTLIMNTLYKAIHNAINKTSYDTGKYTSITGLEYISRVVHVNQSPIGRTPLSNPATYTGIFNHVRDVFALLPESRARGYKVGRFSFNAKGGRCEACSGGGLIKIEMHFLPDVYVTCEHCNGKRYNRETLEITYNSKNISDILDMTCDQVVDFFANHPLIYDKAHKLQQVGLGYLKIGQCSTTLSGGEAQRVKLSKELSKRSSGDSIYILDEPTTGLHFEDINNLLSVLRKLVDKGNTVIVIEHNLDVIKTADYIIDIGPGSGNNGGELIGVGTPEEIVEQCSNKSLTSKYLAQYLNKNK